MSGTALTAQPSTEGERLLSIIEHAAENDNFDPAKMQALMDMKRTWDKDRAIEAFGKAITTFQHRCPAVYKSRTVNAGPLKYQFASFDDVMKQAGPHLSDCGIALSFSTESNDKGIRVTCRVRVGIHAEDYTLDVPIPDMRVNDTQRYGAALSYAKRYALCAALNIVVTDDIDDDGASCFVPITDEQAVQLEALIDQHKIDLAKFKKWLGVDQITNLPAADFQKAMQGIMAKANEKARAT